MGGNTFARILCCVCHHACHVWRDSCEDVFTAAFEVTFKNDFRMVFCGDSDYTKTMGTIKPGADIMFITWRNPNAAFEDGHPQQIGTSLDAFGIATEKYAPKMFILEHYAELDHIYKGFNASYEQAIDIMSRSNIPTKLLFWGNIFRKS